MRRPNSAHITSRLIVPDRGDGLNHGLVAWYPLNEGSGERAVNVLHRGVGKIATGDGASEKNHAIPQWYGYGEHWLDGKPAPFGGRGLAIPAYGALIIPPEFYRLQKFSFACRFWNDDTGTLGPTDYNNWVQGWGVTSVYGGNIYFYISVGYGSNPRVLVGSATAETRRGYRNIVGTYDQSVMRLYVNGAEGEYAAGAVSIDYVTTPRTTWVSANFSDIRFWNRALTRSEAQRYINEGPTAGSLRSPSRRFSILNQQQAASNNNQRFTLLGVGD
jgi:hypothetical protein